MTKRDKPAMSEEEFEKAIKELAQKEFATGKRDDAAYRKLCMQHGETVSPDRKTIYESSMRKTGGKMNAACMFWDNNGNKTLSYNPESRNWKAISTEEEFARARVFTSIYNDELARLKKGVWRKRKGNHIITMEDSKMSISGIGQNYYHNNVATVRNTKNVNSTGKNDGFAGKVTEKNPVSPEDMTLEEYKAYFNEKMNSLYTHPSQRNRNDIIDITDAAYKKNAD